MAVKVITDSTFTQEISNGFTLIDFWATWCGPCRTLSPVVEELSNEMDIVNFGKVNVDENQGVAQQFNVTALPTLILYKNGKAIDQVVGAVPKASLKKFLEKNIQ